MAKSNDQQAKLPAVFMALDENEVILVNTKAPALAMRNVIDEQLSQLRAMLVITYGEETVPLGILPDNLQSDYIWAMARKVRLIQILLELMMSPAGHGQERKSET